jgi:hypothetical protein
MAMPSCNLSRPKLFPVAELANDCGIDLRLPALVHAARLRRGNTFAEGHASLLQLTDNVLRIPQ